MPNTRQTGSNQPSSQALAAGVLAAFLLSGAAGLIHEIAWIRLIRHVMGNTTFAVSTVLAVFMGGLALGSFIGGRFIDRRDDSLRVFALLEAGVAVYGFLLPWLIDASQPIYAHLYRGAGDTFPLLSLGRFFFSALLLLLPATLMGATLPVLTKFFTRSLSDVGWSVGRLYAVNSFGAVLGAAATGFLLIPALGVTKSIYVAGLVNLTAAFLSFRLHRRAPAMPPEPGPSRAARRRSERAGREARRAVEGRAAYPRIALTVLLVGYGLSGFAALTYEVAWTRVLTMMIGSSVYAFSMILTSFILGLAVGSAVSARFSDRIRDPMRALAIIEIAIGLSALLVVPFLGGLPVFATGMISRLGESFARLQLAEFGIVLAVAFVPTFLMGAAFPLANRVFVRRRETVGRSVGTVYASNTLGSILGSFLAGFALIPLLGTQGAIFAAVLLNAAIACAFFAFSASLKPRHRGIAAAAVAAVALAGVLVVPEWNPDEMTLGPYIMARRMSPEIAQSPAAMRQKAASTRILFNKEGHSGTVTVKESDEGELFLSINGKPDASTSPGDLPTEIMLAHTPLVLHPAPRSVLVIGLASGITLGSAGTHPVEVLDCAEISPEVVEASRFFDDYNRAVMEDPRTRVLVVDGRNHLVLGDDLYDVIISEPSNPWIAGVADLFTLEFFEACRDRLTPGGFACVWLETYNVDLEAFQSVVATFRAVFPEMSLWEPPNSNEFLLIGSNGPFAVEYGAVVERMGDPDVLADLARVGIDSPEEFLARLVMGAGGAGRLSDDAPIHTDDNSLLEFSSPRFLASNERRATLLTAIDEHREPDLSFLTGPEEDVAPVRDRAARAIAAQGYVFRARVQWRAGRRDLAVAELREAAALDPGGVELAAFIDEAVEQIVSPGSRIAPEGAVLVLEDLLTVVPEDAGLRFLLASTLVRDDRPEEAAREYARVVELDRDHVDARMNLAVLLGHEGRYDEAVRNYRRVLEVRPEHSQAHYSLAVVLRAQGETDAALEHFARVVEIDPDHARGQMELGATLHQLGRLDEAVAHYGEAVRLNPGLPEAHNALGAALAASGEFERAEASFREALRLRPDFAEARSNLQLLLGGR